MRSQFVALNGGGNLMLAYARYNEGEKNEPDYFEWPF